MEVYEKHLNMFQLKVPCNFGWAFFKVRGPQQPQRMQQRVPRLGRTWSEEGKSLHIDRDHHRDRELNVGS